MITETVDNLKLERDWWKKAYEDWHEEHERQLKELLDLIGRGLKSRDYDEAISTFYKMRDMLDGVE